MKRVRVLLTSCGGLVVPSMIKALRESTDYHFYIVAVDSQDRAVGFYFADKHYVVPNGLSPLYSKALMKIAKREKVDVILPLSDEEALALSKELDVFKKAGTMVACSEYETVRRAVDKAQMLGFLQQRHIPVPLFEVPRNIKGLESAVLKLGYPRVPVVFKPRISRGGRGFWLLRPHVDRDGSFILGRDRQEITLEILLNSLRRIESFPAIMVMEYLEGEDFNVDVLASRGKSLYILPNRRIVPDAGPVRVGIVEKDNKIEKVVRDVVRAFSFDYTVNIELAYRRDRQGMPLPYEINPRISAPIVVNKAAGIDLLVNTVTMALGGVVPTGKVFKETMMIRYWNELFLSKPFKKPQGYAWHM